MGHYDMLNTGVEFVFGWLNAGDSLDALWNESRG